MKLVDEADRHPPQRRSRVVGHRSGVVALDKNLAGVRLFEQACDVEQRRLAGARGRNQRHRLARPNRDVDAAAEYRAEYRPGCSAVRPCRASISRPRSFVAERLDRIEPRRPP